MVTSPYVCRPSSGVLRIAIVGSGPGGFFTAQRLIKKLPNVLVDLIEKLPIPFGLVRFGVAPDHPNVKNVAKKFSVVAKSDKCRFIGNVNVGKDISIRELSKYYSGIVLAHGAQEENYLNIPGEHFKGIYSSKNFIGWYNGLPQHKEMKPDLSGNTAVIIGQGNVAMDIARILLTPIQSLEKTDISSHAVNHLSKSNINRVILVGRRGPLQVAFTIKQLREILSLPYCLARLHQSDFNQYRQQLDNLDKPRRRITELMLKVADLSSEINHNDSNVGARSKYWEMKFFSSPIQFLGTPHGSVRGIRLEHNDLTKDCEAIGIGEYEELDCSVVFRSIKFRNEPIDSCVPFDKKLGIIPNNNGRILDSFNNIMKGYYCSGWARRGPNGSILMTMSSAFQTAESIIEDIKNGKLPVVKASQDILKVLRDDAVTVSFHDWEKLNFMEVDQGQSMSKPREKITSIEEMLKIIRG